MSDLAKRAVACKAWRWMRGMLAVWPDGVPYRSADQWRYVGDGLWVDAHGDTAHEDDMPASLALAMVAGPDLDDPATFGCLLDLVREVWLCAAYTMPCFDGWVAVLGSDRYVGETEPAALVAALEAAP